jgi:hypothetical protein
MNQAEIFWLGSGLLGWLIIIMPELLNGKDIGSNPNAGQAFFIAIILGPLFLFFIAWKFIEVKTNDTKHHKRL